MRIINNPLKDLSRKEIRMLVDAGLVNDDGDFTVDGKNLLWALSFKIYQKEVLAEAKDIVQENREAAIGDLIASRIKRRVNDIRP